MLISSGTGSLEEPEGHYLWIGPLPETRKGIKAVEERQGGAEGARRCPLENFKGELRVHIDMRLRQPGRALTHTIKKDLSTYTQHTLGGGAAANTFHNNILHSCCVSVSEEASWQADTRRRSFGALGVFWVGVVVGADPGIGCIWAERPLALASYSPAARAWTKAWALGLRWARDRPGNTRGS